MPNCLTNDIFLPMSKKHKQAHEEAKFSLRLLYTEEDLPLMNSKKLGYFLQPD